MRKRYVSLLVAFLAACLWSNAAILPMLGRDAFLRTTSTAQLFSEAYLSHQRTLVEERAEDSTRDTVTRSLRRDESSRSDEEETKLSSAAEASHSPSETTAPKPRAPEEKPASPSGTGAATPSRSPANTPSCTQPSAPGTPGPTPSPTAHGTLPYRSESGALPSVPADWRADPALPVSASSKFAYVTLAAGNDAGRMAVALMQSIISSGTDTAKIDLVVLLPTNGLGSPECHDPAWKRAHNRTHIACGRDVHYPDMICEEVISPLYCDALRKLGVKLVVHAAIPHTMWTLGISGGPQAFWGMSLQRMVIFNMTQYAKIVWSDADTLVLKNMDHLFGPEYPTLSSSFTHGCCNRNAPALPGGGLWVLEPSPALGLLVWRMMVEGMPQFHKDGTLRVSPRNHSRVARGIWLQSDMSLIQHMFSDWSRNPDTYRLWPWVRDVRHGHAPGIRAMPLYSGMTDAQFAAEMTDQITKRVLPEGFRPDLVEPVDEGRMVWHALPVQYDQCYSNCDCIPWRWPSVQSNSLFSVHFSCVINGNDKPGKYRSEKELFTAMEGWTDCARYYYSAWYAQLTKALGAPLGEAYDKPPRPLNMTVLNDRPNFQIPVKFIM